MKQKLEEILKLSKERISNVLCYSDLNEIRVSLFGKKGMITEAINYLKELDPNTKPVIGKLLNEVKKELELDITNKAKYLEEQELQKALEMDKIDVTIPGYQFYCGSIHPLHRVIIDIEDFFIGLGYEVKEGPELELDYYNFEMMNLEKDHPARAMQDSFYIDENRLLRTHTSPVQARTMHEKKGQDIKIICPGKVYRRDSDDATHSHQFMQIEGLVVGKKVTFSHLKDVLLKLCRHLFGEEREIRLRPSYFPFTEPSVEVDVVYQKKDGTRKYIEVLGAGMVHPNVLLSGGYDPNIYSGFAFGLGVDRMAILKYEIDDIRSFYTNDIRFLNGNKH